jgi:hypothetical protein
MKTNVNVVLRSSMSGVWFGTLVSETRTSRTLLNARRARTWQGPVSCGGLALHGPTGGEIEAPVPQVTIDRAPGDEMIYCTAEATAVWTKAAVWSQVRP